MIDSSFFSMVAVIAPGVFPDGFRDPATGQVGVYFAAAAVIVTLVLLGIAVNAVTAGIIAYTVFLGDTQAREQIVFWQLGSFNGTRWEAVRIVAPLVLIGLVGVMLIARKLDLLSLGERAARHVGLDVERLLARLSRRQLELSRRQHRVRNQVVVLGLDEMGFLALPEGDREKGDLTSQVTGGQ